MQLLLDYLVTAKICNDAKANKSWKYRKYMDDESSWDYRTTGYEY
jgi:hypothetical protein